MSFVAGARLGVFEILGTLGAGGMGEVYRARDTKLNRDVALKVLPDEVAGDHDRVARFRREAQLLASLNHPAIAAIYGLEESGGIVALALELVEGEDLSERLRRGAIPVEEALAIARQIAEALEEAHERGVVHRDLKPGNVKVTPEGKVKVLDFGLAKAFSGEDVSASGSNRLADSPTMSRHMTEAGVILGTAAYMAPEQARGKTVDKRADIWAFGVVLYEMLSGRQLFGGETLSDVLAAVLTREPTWSTLPAATPGAIVRLLRRCLDRNPKKRLRDIGEAVLVLTDPALAAGIAPEPVARPGATMRERVAWIAAAVALVVAVALAVRGASSGSGPAAWLPLHFSLAYDPSEVAPSEASIAPDGSLVAFRGRLPGAVKEMIFLRSLHQAAARPLAGTEGADRGFFSPDGRWIAFISNNNVLKKIPVEGGAATTLCEADLRYAQPTWADNGKILIAYLDPEHPGVIYEVPEAGGRPTPVAGKPEQEADPVSDPRAFPGGRLLLFRVARGGHPALAVQSLETGERRVLAQDARLARFIGARVIWMENGHLMGAPFDAEHLGLAGAPAAIPTDGLDGGSIPAALDVSASGALFFMRASAPGRASPGSLPGNMTSNRSDYGEPVWVDRQGARSRVAASDVLFSDPRLSPDGARLAAGGSGADADLSDVWAVDLRRGGSSRLSFDPGEDETAVWSPDGAWIAWASSRVGQPRALYKRRSDGSGAEERIWVSDGRHFHAKAWTPDGRGIVISKDDEQTGWDVFVITPGPNPVAKPLLTGPFNESNPRLSPDGHWLVYASDESGRNEIYAQAFPDLGRKVQISVEGGDEPVWNPSGREIVYRAALSRHFMSVSVDERDTLVLSPPRELVSDVGTQRGSFDHTDYDVARDGRLLAMEEAPVDEHVDLHVILGWAQAAGLLK